MDVTRPVESFLQGAGVIVDVRSPSEHRQGHIPGAVNLPLFDDEERAQVGTVYRQDGRTAAVRLGLALAPVLLLLALLLPVRACAALALLALVLHLSLLNQAPTSAYFAQTLQQWEQGRFVRFYGLSQWLGWLWPYATLLVLVLRLSRRERRGGEPTIAPHD